MNDCRIKHCNNEYEQTKIHELKTQELTEIYKSFGKIKTMDELKILFNKFENLSLKSPQIIYSKCIYKHCKKRLLHAVNVLIKNLTLVKKNLILPPYIPQVIKDANLLIKKTKHNDTDILLLSFYLVLSVYVVSNAPRK